MNIVSLSENSVVILFKQNIEPENFLVVSQIVKRIKWQLKELIVDIIPSYTSIHITFNILKTSHVNFTYRLNTILQSPESTVTTDNKEKIIEIPVYYGEEVALDLAFIAAQVKLSTQDIIEIHSRKIYDVYAIGFAPGFAYLGNIDKSIAYPRKETPRQKVTKGSLGIADQQTAIYPSDSPGGWQIIGKTPIALIDYHSEYLTPFSIGDKVKFNPIGQSEYIQLGGILECH